MNQRKVGAILSYLSIGIHSIIGFIYVPMLLMFLSKEQYGLYQLVGSLVAYLAVMDFGLANTTVRYYSQLLAKKDTIGQENLLATMLRVYTGIAVAIMIVAIILLYILLPFYTKTLSPIEIVTAKYVYWIMIFNLMIVIPGHIFVAIIQSHEKFVFLKSVNILNVIAQPILVFIVLHFETSIVALVVVQTICNIMMFSANAYYSIFKLNANFHLHKWDNKFVKEVLIFSFFVFLPSIISLAYWKTGQVILGAVIGTVSVAIYSIAIQFSSAFMSLSTAVSGVFLPKVSSITAKTDDMTEINNIFIKTGRLQFLLLSLVFCGFIIYGKQFIIFWVGSSFLDAYLYALLLMAGLFVCLIQSVGISVLQAKNKHYFRSKVYFILGIFNILASIPMAKKYGALGCAITTTFCLFLGQTVIMNIYYNKIGIKILDFFKQIFSMAIPIFVVFIIGLSIEKIFYTSSFFFYLSKILLFVLIFILLTWNFAFNQYEKDLIRKPINSIYRRFRS
ncbi:oligosaccharide flippase family protein [Candidatus Ruminimicrobium bovinum]|uniref:oligosaccharide flippase family protein n=1 Tax=Candidatus Ruminimicrobium bovinum TaxID=3242779 RepID=UPI0039B9BA79